MEWERLPARSIAYSLTKVKRRSKNFTGIGCSYPKKSARSLSSQPGGLTPSRKSCGLAARLLQLPRETNRFCTVSDIRGAYLRFSTTSWTTKIIGVADVPMKSPGNLKITTLKKSAETRA